MRSLTLLFVVSVGTLFTSCTPQKECEDPNGCNTGGGTATGGGGGETDGGTYSNFEFCSDGVRAQYEYSFRCGSVTRDEADREIARRIEGCKTPPISVAAGRSQTNLVAAKACLAELQNLPCTATQSSAACSEIVVGLVAAGGDCFTSDECTSGLWCNNGATCPGKCEARVAVGQPSNTPTGDDCAVGAYRYGANCEARIALDASCAPQGGVSATRRCVTGARCSAAETCVTNIHLDVDAACTPNVEPDCREGTNCINNVCTKLGDVNDPCVGAQLCKTGLRCNDAKVCVPLSSPGQACSIDSHCLAGNFCNNGQCTPRRTANGTCTGDQQCLYPLWCNGSVQTPGTCVQRLSEGEPCQKTSQYTSCVASTYCTTLVTNAATGECAPRAPFGGDCNASQCVAGAICVAGKCEVAYCAP